MNQFPHLKFIGKLTGKPRYRGGGGGNQRTEANKNNRISHGNLLLENTNGLKNNWRIDLEKRDSNGLAEISSEIVPVFLQMDPDLLKKDQTFHLESFGIEIISEESDGYIIGASLDNLQSLQDKIVGFISKVYTTGKIAEFWHIFDGKREDWKPKHVLSPSLYEKWNRIEDDQLYKLEVGIAFDKPLGKQPDPTKRGGQARLEKFRQKQIERGEALIERENHFEKFIKHYGQITSGFVYLEDSFGCEVEIVGKGLKDLVVNYQFVFDVVEGEQIEGFERGDHALEGQEIEILPPDFDSPEIGVIDSGIMENHRLLSFAVKGGNSKSYVPNISSISDDVQPGGHGTRVAGAILFPDGISNLNSPYQLPFFVRNLKILDEKNELKARFPAELMYKIVNENPDCKIFNLSINSHTPFRHKHMSMWAAMIDSLIFDNNVLFVISSGNLKRNDIRYYLGTNNEYPDYLFENHCRVANPGQSSFGITVGSINSTFYDDQYWESIGKENEISAFSRVGLGIWGHVKPDVVEYGGGLVRSKNGVNQVRGNAFTSPELLRTNASGGISYGKDTVGTSFASPKVSNLLGHLVRLYPNENINLLRALLIQGARLPEHHFFNPTTASLRHFGYGIPSLERVSRNSEQRITFFTTSKIRADEGDIYSLKIPEILRSPGDEYEVLIEVTLAYSSKVRRTRQRTKSYLGTWLDWKNSYLNETREEFENRMLKEINGVETINPKVGNEKIPWKLRESTTWGEIENVSRNNSTVQKDWAIMNSFDLPSEISFSIRGHKGWDRQFQEIPYAFVISIEILNANVPVYESIRIENELEIEIEN